MDTVATDFQQLVDAHYAALYRFAFQLAKNESDAADLTQQAFYSWAAKGQHQLRDDTGAKSWLFTTLYREFLGKRRHLVRFPHEPLEPGDSDPVAEVATAGRSMDGQSAIEALAQLEEDYRAPLTLFYLEAFSYKEIADVLGVPIGTVMSRLSRGKEILRRILRPEDARSKVIPIQSMEGGINQ